MKETLDLMKLDLMKEKLDLKVAVIGEAESRKAFLKTVATKNVRKVEETKATLGVAFQTVRLEDNIDLHFLDIFPPGHTLLKLLL